MINYTANFFKLEIIRIKDIQLHESTEFNRLRNIFNRIAGSKHLMNPVIVGRIADKLILIDGANRLSTLREIGCKLVIAQIIDYNDKKILLRKWNHLVYKLSLNTIRKYCKDNQLIFQDIKYKDGKKILKNKFHYILVTDINFDKSILIKLSNNFALLLNQLNEFTKFYFADYTFDRSEEEIKTQDLEIHTRKKGILIEFPLFTKKQIIRISNNNLKVPAGITRHILDNRVLHVRYEIDKLKSDKDIIAKNNELDKYLINKIDNNKVRQYRESVIVFDE